MNGETAALKGKLDRLLKEAAELSVALGRSQGTISGVPHYVGERSPCSRTGSTAQSRDSGEPDGGTGCGAD